MKNDAYLKLITKLEELDAYTHTVLHQFPKLERHLLCAEMRAAERVSNVDEWQPILAAAGPALLNIQ